MEFPSLEMPFPTLLIDLDSRPPTVNYSGFTQNIGRKIGRKKKCTVTQKSMWFGIRPTSVGGDEKN